MDDHQRVQAKPGDTMGGTTESWVCPCGNDPMAYGFYPINSRYKPVEPMLPDWDRRLYGCFRCGAVIDEATEVVIDVTDVGELRRLAII